MIKKNICLLFFLSLAVVTFSQREIEEVSVTNLRMLNSPAEDFIAVPYGEGIMYNTNVKDNKCDTCRLQNLRYASMKPGEDCSFTPGIPVPNNFKVKNLHYGAPTFSSDGEMMIISQNNSKPRDNRDRKKTMKLVTATKSKLNTWERGADLPFNSTEFETIHPALSADGQKLYFASNRPDGFGGMDIWYVTKSGDTWSAPVNMGPTINSIGNELFPSIGNNGNLYFSSNKAGGAGGLDVYKAMMVDGAWTTSNLGAPFNSRADDLGYVELPDGESGYLTSNRAGGQGKDDLYCWKVNKAPVKLAVEDASNSNRLPGSQINIVGPQTALDYIADGNGGAEPDITYRRNYTISATKEGYEPWSKEVSAKELASVEEYIIPLVKRTYQMEVDAKYLESEAVVPGAEIILRNKTTGEEQVVTADENGRYIFNNIHCVDDYELLARKDGKESKLKDLPSSQIDCSGEEATKVTLYIPNPPPPPPPVCDYYNVGKFSLPVDGTAEPKAITALGNRPEFGNSHDLDATGFYEKLKNRYERSTRDKEFLDELFIAMGYPNGFMDISAYSFSEAVVPNGSVGNMGYTKRHRLKYVQLNAKNDRDLQAFRVSSPTGCDIYFMKTCGNLFLFR